MKYISLCFFVLIVGAALAQNGKLTLRFEWAGIEEGYDHTVKDLVFIDGELVATTEEHKGSSPISLSVKTTRGNHTIKTVSMTLYQGNWEFTRVDNDYSIDGFTEQEYKIGKKSNLLIIYDLDNGPDPISTFE